MGLKSHVGHANSHIGIHPNPNPNTLGGGITSALSSSNADVGPPVKAVPGREGAGGIAVLRINHRHIERQVGGTRPWVKEADLPSAGV